MAFCGQTKTRQKNAVRLMGWIGCPILQVAQKAIMKSQYFCNLLIKET
jgi:hypothetical protein